MGSVQQPRGNVEAYNFDEWLESLCRANILDRTLVGRFRQLHQFLLGHMKEGKITDLVTVMAAMPGFQLRAEGVLLLAHMLFQQPGGGQLLEQANHFPHKELFEFFCFQDNMAQLYLIGAIEQQMERDGDELMPQIETIFKQFVANEYLDSNVVIAWVFQRGLGTRLKFANEEITSEMRKRVKGILPDLCKIWGEIRKGRESLLEMAGGQNSQGEEQQQQGKDNKASEKSKSTNDGSRKSKAATNSTDAADGAGGSSSSSSSAQPDVPTATAVPADLQPLMQKLGIKWTHLSKARSMKFAVVAFQSHDGREWIKNTVAAANQQQQEEGGGGNKGKPMLLGFMDLARETVNWFMRDVDPKMIEAMSFVEEDPYEASLGEQLKQTDHVRVFKEICCIERNRPCLRKQLVKVLKFSVNSAELIETLIRADARLAPDYDDGGGGVPMLQIGVNVNSRILEIIASPVL